jgi:4-diphosphocytidyl-2-C-methyl-D-erythritol kinase
MPENIYRVKTPAKLNIRLKITGLRPDGYHELVSIMVPIDLFDLLELDVNRNRSEIRLTCEGLPVPADKTNLVTKAARSFFSETALDEGVSIKLTKKIPVAAGMGGGSSDAAATLLALNEMWSRPLTLSRLHGLAAQLGADVPFFLYSRPAIATGIGENLEPLTKWPRFWYVIVTPSIQVSTSWVYRHLKLKLTPNEYTYIKKSLSREEIPISHLLENDLEKVTSASFPIIHRVKRHLTQGGAEGALMTGSGPSVFGVFLTEDLAVSAKRQIISQNLGDVFLATNWEKEEVRLNKINPSINLRV